jgi:hypothetical protein
VRRLTSRARTNLRRRVKKYDYCHKSELLLFPCGNRQRSASVQVRTSPQRTYDL